jgi:serine/threonine protein kinase
VIPRENPVPLQEREREASLSASLADVLDLALRPNPARRYQSATELKAAWEAAFNTAF